MAHGNPTMWERRLIYGMALMGVVFERSLDAACYGVVLPEEEPGDCCNYDFDEDRGMAPGVRGHCYVPGTRRYEIKLI